VANIHFTPVPDSTNFRDRSTQRKQTGNRVIKPKKTALVKQQQMKKVRSNNTKAKQRKLIVEQKHSAGLTEMTEKSLASKAGHLEILRGGKKEAKASGPQGKAGKKGK
jgi:hypothetical protein